MNRDELKKIPGVDSLLSEISFPASLPESLQTYFIRTILDDVRDSILNGEDCPAKKEIVRRISERMNSLLSNRIRPVINGTGVILHTNLGRAPYSPPSAQSAHDVAEGYSNLEQDLETGKRGGRGAYAEALLNRLTGADASAIVNNCSAALVLTLKTLAEDQEVLISRGELVQIGGGFRIPQILEESGAHLHEVGTTNRTELDDYRSAQSRDTGLVLQVHRSNFNLVGFTERPPLMKLVEWSHEQDLPLVCDLGSGALVDTEQYGLRHETRPSEVLEAGADLVMFSGDKLLGGPQAGLLAGKQKIISDLKTAPLFRALRCDKSILTALEETLSYYAGGRIDEIPVYRMFSLTQDQLRERAQNVISSLSDGTVLSPGAMVSTVGGGALPSEEIPSAGIVFETDDPDELVTRLRRSDPPVIGRIRDGDVHLDLRTVPPERDHELTKIIESVSVP